MGKFIKGAIAAAALAAGTIAATAPAEAHVSDGVAVAAGLLGLGVGAAIASDHPRHYYREYDYYAPPPPPPPVYGYEYVERCRVFDRWDPYEGRYIETRRCY